MDLNEILIHDSTIITVSEDSEKDKLTFMINMYKGVTDFGLAYIDFENVLNYEIHEGPFSGSPVILGLIEDGKRTDYGHERTKIKIETTAGYRSLFCTDVLFRETQNNVYVLQHTHQIDDNNEDVKLIGIYSSEKSAKQAIDRLSDKSGFNKSPDLFSIDEYTLDKDNWTEGFITL